MVGCELGGGGDATTAAVRSDFVVVASPLGDDAAMEGFFGLLKRERINRRPYRTLADARSDVFDYIERFHNHRMQRRLDARDQAFRLLTQPSVETG